MRYEKEYINQMINKIMEAIHKNEFDKYLMGEENYLVASREIPVMKSGTGNLYGFMMRALKEIQKNHPELDLEDILQNGIEQLIYKSPYGLLNAAEVIRSILNTSKEIRDSLGIEREDLQLLTEQIINEVKKNKQQLKDTISMSNLKMSIYDCLEFYNMVPFDEKEDNI